MIFSKLGAIFLSCITLISGYPQSGEAKNAVEQIFDVLFLSSYTEEWPIVPKQINGIRDSIIYLDITYEYLDSKNIAYNDSRKIEFNNYLVDKYGFVLDFDLIITGDDNALDFVMSYENTLFKDIPVVFEGVNNISLAEKAILNENFCGLVEIKSYYENIKMAMNLIESTKVNVIYDESSSGIGEYQQFLNDIEYFPNLFVNQINCSRLTVDQIIEKISKIKSNELSFYLLSSQSLEGIITQEESDYILSSSVNTPIFSANCGIGQFFVGGYVYDHYNACSLVGSIASSILHQNMKPSEIGILKTEVSNHAVDYSMMEKYSLDFTKLPEGTLILDRTFYGTYKNIINLIIIGLVILLMIILVFVLLAFNNRFKAKELALKNNNLKELLQYDIFTSLYNRKKFDSDCNELIFNKSSFFVISIKVTNYGLISSTYGDFKSNIFIQEISSKLRNLIKDDCTLYRYSQDVFSFVIKTSDRLVANEFCDGIFAIERERIDVADGDVSCHFNVCLICYPNDINHLVELTKAINFTFTYMAQDINSSLEFFNSSKIEIVNKESILIQNIRKAIKENKVSVAFQPVYCTHKNIIRYFEALVRIDSITEEPNVFIPLAERSGDIIDLQRIILLKTIEFIKELDKNGFTDVRVNVYVSEVQFYYDKSIAFLNDTLNKYEIFRNRISFDFSRFDANSKIGNSERFINYCKENNIYIQLNGCSSGFSTVVKFSNSNFKIIKFSLFGITKVKFDDNLINIIKVFKDLGFKIAIVGAETKADFELFKKHGIDYIQGFYISRPLSNEDAIKFLARYKKDNNGKKDDEKVL